MKLQQQPLDLYSAVFWWPAGEAVYCTVQLYSGCTVQRPGAGLCVIQKILRPNETERGWGLDQLTRVRLLYKLYTACTVQYKDLHYHLSCQTD